LRAPSRWAVILVVACVTATLAPPSRADVVAARDMGDETQLSEWTLANGLRVLVRELPGAGHVAISVAYPVGTDHDPAGREGTARLMAELYLTAAAGSIPDRTRAELDHLRPAGWSLQVSPRVTLFTEIATKAQFADILRQTGVRMAGVQLDSDLLKRANASVTAQLGDVYFRNPATGLYYEVRDQGRGWTDDQFLRLTTGKGVAAISLQDARRRLQRYYGPAHAVLSIAGDVRNLDVQGMVQNFFGGAAARGEVPPEPSDSLRAGVQPTPRNTVAAPVGTVAVIAPALTDSLHPAFYIAALLLASSTLEQWGPALPPLSSRFEYRLFDDPSLVRYYPSPDRGDVKGASLSSTLATLSSQMQESLIPVEMVAQLRENIEWLFGGKLQPSLLQQLQREPTSLGTLANSAAVRELWGGEAFWSRYRQRFERADRGDWERGLKWLGDAQRHLVRLYVPRSGAK